jgi:ADP-heptose:LPS heptosyltransferase
MSQSSKSFLRRRPAGAFFSKKRPLPFPSTARNKDILVIKLSALGDIILAFPAMAAIRAAHPRARITLLTTPPYAPLLAASPYFNHIEIDRRARFWDLPSMAHLRRQLAGYDLVYDLQTSARSSAYFKLAGRPAWSGIAKGCLLPHDDPGRNSLHTRERLAGQLHDAGIFHMPPPDLAWLKTASIAHLNLPDSFTLLIPGASAHRPEKRWPYFAELARQLANPVILGGQGEGAGISGLNLAGQTTLLELAAITARATLAIGNDTGPMHLAAALGIPSIVLFSAASNPDLTAPRYPDGSFPTILRAPNLQDLPVAEVLQALP